MKMFDEVVNDITKDGYCVELTQEPLRQIFDMLPYDTKWNGVYHGWQEWSVWKEVCEVVHQYMREWHC
ncbi:hypothetical protein COJ25_17165 [Bacillus cereus]|nr:hypothetical protein COJ25_17165 [Bacillus cereus]